MKQTVNRYQFQDAFKGTQYETNFSYEGLNKLFEYLEGYEESTGEEIELDVVAICCDYAEESLADVLENYSLDSLDELQDNTSVIVVDDETVIYVPY